MFGEKLQNLPFVVRFSGDAALDQLRDALVKLALRPAPRGNHLDYAGCHGLQGCFRSLDSFQFLSSLSRRLHADHVARTCALVNRKPPIGEKDEAHAIDGASAYIQAMIEYRPDPKNPRHLTPEEARRLDETPIDYSDIPPLGDEFFSQARSVTDDFTEIDWSEWSQNPATDELPAGPLFGEQWVAALLLQMVVHHCATAPADHLDTHNIRANAEALIELSYGGEVEIIDEAGDDITAKLTPRGRALLERLRAGRLVIDWSGLDWSQCPEVESVPGRCSGAWVVKETRVTVQGILDNAGDCSAEEIASEIFPSVPVEIVRRILAFAGVGA